MEKKKIINFKGRLSKAPVIGLLVVLIAFIIFSSLYSVSEQEQAVVTMFGKVTDVKTAGLYFKIPFIQKVHMVDTTTQGMQIGYTTYGNSESYPGDVVEAEAVMITSDFNFVDIDFYLEYRVSDPVRFLYASAEPQMILKNLTTACVRSTVINYTVDEAITTAKNQIQSQVREKLTQALKTNDIGIEIVNLTVQDAEPPTSDVMQAFKAVETAKQGAETAVNNAKQYQNEQIPAAEAEADRIIQDAEAAKQTRIAEAEGQVARFSAMYEEYAKNPQITRQRLYYEAIEDVLPGIKVIIDNGETQKVLPLSSFTESDGESTSDKNASGEVDQNGGK